MRAWAVLALACLTTLQGQDQPSPPAFANTVDLARTAPPELFADTIIKLAEADTIPAGETRTALLEEAFGAAARAQEPVRFNPVPGLPPDARAVFRSKASELGLDSLTLQIRIVKLFSKSDPAEARQLFQRVAHPSIARPACENPLIPDASEYMEMSGLVASVIADDPEAKPVDLLRTALDAANSPAEVAAFTLAIEPLSFEPEEWQLLLAGLAAKMEGIAPDYRSFTISIASMRDPLEKIAARAAEEGFDASVLPRGFRRFLTTQMSAPRCDEDFGDARQMTEWFNASFRGTLDPIADGEIEPSQRLATFQAESYFASRDAKRISETFARLKTKPDAASPEWRSMLSDFLRDFSGWTPSGSEIDTFHQKAVVLRGLLELVPTGTERDMTLAQCLGFLRTSRAEALYPAEWLLQVKALVDAAGPDAAGMKEAFRGSGDAGLALFAAMN